MKDTNMKLTKFAKLLVLGLVLTVAASACHKKPVGVTPLPGAKAGAPPEMAGGGVMKPTPFPVETGPTGQPITEPTGHPSNLPGLHEGWIEDAQALKADAVYFDFDSSVIKTAEKPKVVAVADYLKANSANAVRVEGNCDERGTEEYNRALGERRALAVREELIRLGIPPTNVDTISYGKDKPVDPGHDESAWKKNRRDDFIVLTPPGK
jgi:peptidoglycan-associated lipoprotein